MPKSKSTSLVPYSQSTDLVATAIKEELALIEDPIFAREIRAHAQDIYELSRGRFDEEIKAASFAAGTVQLFHEHPGRFSSLLLLRKYPGFNTLEIDSVLRFAKALNVNFKNALEWLKLNEVKLSDLDDEIDSAIFDSDAILNSFPRKAPGMTGFNNFDCLMFAHNMGTDQMQHHIVSLSELAEYFVKSSKDEWLQ
jgi:hypothetical protein